MTDDPGLSGGFCVKPTIYAGVDNSSRTAQEEIFGPVLVSIPFDDEPDAIRIASDSGFGLVAGVITRDIGRALRVAGEIEAERIFLNTWSTGHVRTPFGGHKNSGYGREKVSRRCSATRISGPSSRCTEPHGEGWRTSSAKPVIESMMRSRGV